MNHVVTRSVRDSALVLDLTHGREPGSLFDIAPPAQSYLSYAQTSPGKLRIAFSTESPLGMAVNLEAIKAVEKTVALLQSLGHEVEEAKPDIDMRQMCLDWLNVWFAQCATTVAHVRAQTGCGLQEFEADTLAMTMVGRAIPADEYAMAQARWQNYMIALDQFLQQRDFWLTPTMAEPPLRVGTNDTPKTLKALSRTFAALGAGKVMRLSGQLEEQALLSFHIPSWPMSPAYQPCPCRCTGATTACHWACSLLAPTVMKASCCHWQRSWSRRSRGSIGWRCCDCKFPE